MGSVTEHFIIQEEENAKRREHKLMIKMRSRGLKRPKCKSKLVMTVSGVCFMLFVAIFFLFWNVTDEIEQLPYEGESSENNYARKLTSNQSDSIAKWKFPTKARRQSLLPHVFLIPRNMNMCRFPLRALI